LYVYNRIGLQFLFRKQNLAKTNIGVVLGIVNFAIILFDEYISIVACVIVKKDRTSAFITSWKLEDPTGQA
jgi:hypothetical protein